jgi:hypothetical protein
MGVGVGGTGVAVGVGGTGVAVGVGGTGVAVGSAGTGVGAGVGPQADKAAPAPSRAESRKNSRRDRFSHLSELEPFLFFIVLLLLVRFSLNETGELSDTLHFA